MTDDEINEAVARKLGWVEAPKGNPYSYNWKPPEGNKLYNPYTLPDFCHSIEAAFEIMEKHDIALFKTKQGRWCTYTNFGLSEDQTEEWYFRAENLEWQEGGIFVADTAPMAICLAFLKLP